MERKFAEALSSCVIENGNLTVSNDVDIKELGDVLRREIQIGNVPHNKVIASKIYLSNGKGADMSVISKPIGVSKSYVELQNIYQDLVFLDYGGRKPDDVEFYSSAVTQDLGYLYTESTTVNTENDSIKYVSEPYQKVKFLIKDVDVIKFTDVMSELRLITTLGTGVQDFALGSVASGIKEKSGYVPVLQYFNLTMFLAVCRYMEGDTTIRFIYKRDINEDVLQEIIRRYGQKLLMEEI